MWCHGLLPLLRPDVAPRSKTGTKEIIPVAPPLRLFYAVMQFRTIVSAHFFSSYSNDAYMYTLSASVYSCSGITRLQAYIYIYIGNIGPEEIAIGDFNKDWMILTVVCRLYIINVWTMKKNHINCVTSFGVAGSQNDYSTHKYEFFRIFFFGLSWRIFSRAAMWDSVGLTISLPAVAKLWEDYGQRNHVSIRRQYH